MRKSQTSRMVMGTVLLMSMGISFLSAASEGQWKKEGSTWYYYENGNRVTDTWKRSGNHWYYLGSNGEMLTNTMVEDRYVNEAGARVSNEWHQVSLDGESNWYYFTDKAVMAADGWKTIQGEKYHFDSDGRMSSGWINENLYYLGNEDDGVMKTGWHHIRGAEDSAKGDEEAYFYFDSNGKNIKNHASRMINGYTYAFDEDGRMLYGWVDVKHNILDGEFGASNQLSDYRYYKDHRLATGIDGSRYTGWKKMSGPEFVNGSHDDDTWFYFKDGAPYAAKDGSKYQIRSINGKKYCFDQNGEMQTGFVKISDADLSPSTSSDASQMDVYYFGKSSDGAMRTGVHTITDEETGERATYYFTSQGRGYHGVKNGYVYKNGKRLVADSDDKYQVVTDGTNNWLVNSSGKIQRSSSSTDKKYTDGSGNVFMVNNQGQITSKLPDGYIVRMQ